MRNFRLLPLAFALPLAIAAPALAETEARHITVTGEGQVAAAPDMGLISLGVTVEAESAAAALAANTEEMARVLAFLKEEGIAERDVQTSGLSLFPRYDGGERSTGHALQITGFVATNTVSVRVRYVVRTFLVHRALWKVKCDRPTGCFTRLYASDVDVIARGKR